MSIDIERSTTGRHAITGRDPKSGRSLTLHVDGGLILEIEPSDEECDSFLSPGLVDLQVNGYGGFDANDPDITVEIVSGLVDALLARGVTTFAPTLITASEERLCHALGVIASARRTLPRVAACIPFVHVEGPHISPLDGYRGAHSIDDVRPPSVGEFERWQRAGEGIVGMGTLSPHFDESVSYIAMLAKRGIHIAIGHTHAAPEAIRRAIDAGARLATHLGNGISTEIHRHKNSIWPLLADDRVTAALISDGHHLPADVLKVATRVKGPEHIVLVSDAVALAGRKAGVYSTPVGGRVELREDGRLCVLGSELLAGATASLAECVGHLVRATGTPLYEALGMATANPGALAGGRGRLRPGMRADVIRFRWEDRIVIEDVWLAGEKVHASEAMSSRRMAQ